MEGLSSSDTELTRPMLILLEGPDHKRLDQVSAAVRFYEESFYEKTDGSERDYAPPSYRPGTEQNILLRGWHWSALAAVPDSEDLPFSFEHFRRIERRLGRLGCLAVFVEPSSKPAEHETWLERWETIVEGSRLPKYRLTDDANLNIAVREMLALALLLSSAGDESEPERSGAGR